MDWSRFTKRINIAKSKDEILKCWSCQSEIENWFLSLAEFTGSGNKLKSRNEQIEAGDIYKWMWHGANNEAYGEILTSDSSSDLKFTFLGCVVSIFVKEEAGENIITLEQSQIPTDESSKVSLHVGCSRGWTFYLTNLKSYCEGGLDLRNRNMSLKDVINS